MHHPPELFKKSTSFLLILFAGCATLFGWDIHAPGIFSQNFSQVIQPAPARVALYLEPGLSKYQSKNKGSRTADPQTYHVGEALAPMLIEGFQEGFQEFIFIETEPTPEILKRYGISHLVAVRVKEFGNKVTWKGQSVTLLTEAAVFDQEMNLKATFESRGTSAAIKTFAKKGGPEVNLNLAIENNVLALVEYVQEWVKGKNV